MLDSLNESLKVLHLFLLVKVWKLVEDLISGLWHVISVIVESLTSDSSGQLKVLLLKG